MSEPTVFGAPAPPPVPEVEGAPGGSRKSVAITVAAGVVALGVLGGAAFLVMNADEPPPDVALPAVPPQSAIPSPSPTAVPPTPLPTAQVQGRNVFVPLVDDVTEAASPAASDVGTAAPGSEAAVRGALALSAPTVTVTEATAIRVPGPAVTESVTVPGPTVTVPGPVETVDRFAYAVKALSVNDPDRTVDGDSTALFEINGVQHEVAEGDPFLDVFLYQGYTPADPPGGPDTVTFYFGSSLWSVTTGVKYGLGPR